MKKIIPLSIIGFLFFACTSDVTEENSNNSLIATENEVTINENIENPYTEFINFCNGLEKVPENAKVLKNKYLDLVGGFTEEQIDSAFFEFDKFVGFMEIPEADEIILNKYNEKETKKLEKKYADLGFKMGSSEGYYFIYTDINFLKSVFYETGTEALKNCLDFQALINIQMFSDGGLVITYTELAEILLSTESYLFKLKNSPYYNNAFAEYKWYLQVLMFGLDNTPIITYEKPHKLTPDIKNAYDLILKDKSRKTRFIIEDHLKYLEKINYDLYTLEYKDTQRDKSYIEEKLGLN